VAVGRRLGHRDGVAGKLLLVLPATVVTVELVVVGLAVALFVLGSVATIAGMLAVAVVACALTLRRMRSPR
jgi:hypothetical protein